MLIPWLCNGSYTPFTQYNRLSNPLYNRFDNRLYRVNKHPTGCQTGCQTVLTTGLNEQTVRSTWLSDRLHNPVWHPCWTNSCSFNRLSRRVVQPVWQPAVYTIQPFVKLIVKWVWQPVECLYTRYNRLSNRFNNRLYRVKGALEWLVYSCLLNSLITFLMHQNHICNFPVMGDGTHIARSLK